MIDTINRIRELYEQRRTYIEQRKRLTNCLMAKARSQLAKTERIVGNVDREAWRKAGEDLFKEARASNLERSAAVQLRLKYDLLFDQLEQLDAKIADLELGQKDPNTNKRRGGLRDAVGALPVIDWALSIPGINTTSLAAIIGESGTLSYIDDKHPGYANVAKLWKRLCLGMVQLENGKWERQQKRKDVDAARAHGYNPERRSAMYMISTNLIRKGCPYREIYLKRRERTLITHPEWATPKSPSAHYYADALRITVKRFIADLWEEWNGVETSQRVVKSLKKLAAE